VPSAASVATSLWLPPRLAANSAPRRAPALDTEAKGQGLEPLLSSLEPPDEATCATHIEEREAHDPWSGWLEAGVGASAMALAGDASLRGYFGHLHEPDPRTRTVKR
jgi:hypothetical protein